MSDGAAVMLSALRAERLQRERLEAMRTYHVRRIMAAPIAADDSDAQDEHNARGIALDAINAELAAPRVSIGPDGWPVMDWTDEGARR